MTAPTIRAIPPVPSEVPWATARVLQALKENVETLYGLRGGQENIADLLGIKLPGASPLGDLLDVTVTTPADNEVLTYLSGQWVNQALPPDTVPGGLDTHVQFNNAGAFGGSANLTWNGSRLAIVGDLSISSGQFVYFDGGGNTYLQEFAADDLRVVVGGALRASWSTGQVNHFDNTFVVGNDTSNVNAYFDAGTTGDAALRFRQNNVERARVEYSNAGSDLQTILGSTVVGAWRASEVYFPVGVTENAVSVAASDVDCHLGTYFYKTITASTTFTFSNPAVTGEVTAFMLELTNGAVASVFWPASVDWAGGVAPTLTTGVDILTFVTRDGGTTWHGAVFSTNSS